MPQPIPLMLANVLLALDWRGFMPCPSGVHTPDHRERRDETLLAEASTPGRDGPFDYPLVTGAGRRAGAIQTGVLVRRYLQDSRPIIRQAAAIAIGDALSGVQGELAGVPPEVTTEAIAFGRAALEARLKTEQDDEAAGAMLETLGRLNFGDQAADDVELELAAYAGAAPDRLLGVARGLEALIRQRPRRLIRADTRARLRQLADARGDPATATPSIEVVNRTRRVAAMLALEAARDGDWRTLTAAASDADWQVRRIAVKMLNPTVDTVAPVLARALADDSFHVRFEALGVAARQVASAKTCAPLLSAVDDSSPMVAMRALDLMPASCADADAVLRKLVTEAASLADPSRDWHVPARALAALARLSPADAKRLNDQAVEHRAWQVRATAVAVAGAIGESTTAVRLATDREANVRNAALEGLALLKSPALSGAAIEALRSDDYQLIRTAARVLQGATAREDAVSALLAALRRLTDAAKDTSRDPRVAILDRLAELVPAARTGELAPFLVDFDRQVRLAAGKAMARASGSPAPSSVPPSWRAPYQPSAQELTSLPRHASIEMDLGGTIELELLVADAPVTIARFARLVKSGYYNGLTFHRVVPNFVIQGGSPGANEYQGDVRYMRDEVGPAKHVRGAVGISTRGRDTGDGQLFIDLVDLPRLDHAYTVFARVVAGMDIVDRVLEGATIKAIAVK